MSIFRILKYSSLIYFLSKHRSKLSRSAVVLLFAFVSSLIYDDVRIYLAQQHPGTLIYALIAKIVIVYGSLVFVLLQFRNSSKASADGKARAADLADKHHEQRSTLEQTPPGHLDALADVEEHDHLRSRYDRILRGKGSSKTSSKGAP
ncbi:hypothetical protein [Congregibacter litoralis]|uniref:Uncharacterized protein n=1 Tax=Congregibacter litoralis KT71 TaxID=314285 RepID=A4AC53_9GAMM|nr:hypothetical protein [Congregibacter litoralis]EAQ96503.1 hypothetical protein KT71_05747 [Congregibacter litoralis KT71]